MVNELNEVDNGWDGANESQIACELCGYEGNLSSDVKMFHRIAGSGTDHISVCKKCAGVLSTKLWFGCGCGG